MNTAEFIKETFKENNGYCFRPVIVCNDGFKMSVQGYSGHYCRPRTTQNWYLELEIGFPSQEESLIMPYAESSENPTQTVYGWVPIEIIDEVIIKHGGINKTETLK